MVENDIPLAQVVERIEVLERIHFASQGNVPEISERLSRIETDIGWIKKVGGWAVPVAIAVLGWLGLQTYEANGNLNRIEATLDAHGERMGRIEDALETHGDSLAGITAILNERLPRDK